MDNVINFPIENLRQEIRDGYVSENTRKLMQRALSDLEIYKPNSWDRRFCEDMLTHSKTLSSKQSEQLERVLDDILEKTEHPSFTPKFDLSEPSSDKNDT